MQNKLASSSDQHKQALRGAAVPTEEFEAAVESDQPPTITALAERGTRKVLMDQEGIDPEVFKLATGAHGMIDRFADLAARLTPEQVVAGTFPRERADLRESGQTLRAMALIPYPTIRRLTT